MKHHPVIRWVTNIGLILILIGSFGFLIHQITRENTLGYDFFSYWNSTRAFLRDGLNPYSTEVAIRNQIGLFGHPTLPQNDPLYFRYPIYTIIVIAPFTYFSFDWAQAFWMAFNVIVLLLCSFIGFPQVPKWQIVIFIFFYQTAFGLIVGNLSTIAGSILILCIGILLKNKEPDRKTQILMGMMLVFTTVKPQLSWLFLIWIVFNSYQRKLHFLLYAFFITIISLSLAMMIALPTWPLDFFRLLFTYQKDANLVSVWSAMFSPLVDLQTSKIIGILLLMFFISISILMIFRKNPSGRYGVIILLSSIGVATFLVHPSGFSNEQVCLLIPVLAWMDLDNEHKSLIIPTWLIMFFLSYTFFIIEKTVQNSQVLNWGPFLTSVAWLGMILMLSNKNKSTQQSETNI